MRATLARNWSGVNAFVRKSRSGRYPMRARTRGSSGSPPSTRTVPLVGRTTPSIVLMKVVFPAPLSPISPNAVPRGIAMSSPASAVCPPVRRKRPR